MVAAQRVDPNPAFGACFNAAAVSLPGDIEALRRQSFERFMQIGLPTTRAELWKYTNLSHYLGKPLARTGRVDLGGDLVANHLAGGPKARRLIFVNGYLHDGLSHIQSLPPGARVVPLSVALSAADAALPALFEWQTSERSMTALNAALCDHGVVIELDEDVVLADPIQLLFLTKDQAASMSHPRLIIKLKARSRLQLIESHVCLDGSSALTNIITQTEIGDDAALIHDRLQHLSGESSIVSRAVATVGGNARFDLSTVALGGALIRNESEIRLKGSNADVKLKGVYLPTGNEHVDHVIQVHHQAQGCRSEQLYKGVMRDRGEAAFQGKIFVHKDAQQTNAYQTNNNLLLSDDATINSKPELEIYADDVKCSHGATCGDLDADALFYLRSRGIDAATAESLLTYAFLAEVLERIGDQALRKQAIKTVIGRLPGGDALEWLL